MKRIVIFGGTGFVGRHLIDRVRPHDESALITIVSRNPPLFVLPKGLDWFQWDASADVFPDVGVFDAAIHAATPARASLFDEQPEAMFEQMLNGVRGVLKACERQKSAPRLLFTSSGAVYGTMPPRKRCWNERDPLAHGSMRSVGTYARGKQLAEEMVLDAFNRGECEAVIVRLFAFSGRHLPLDAHFAVGNFVGNVLRGDPIDVRGDGTPVRSYMDGDEMADWIWKALFSDKLVGRVVNIGSENQISIRDLAFLVADIAEQEFGVCHFVRFRDSVSSIDGTQRYVPSTRLIRRLLGVVETSDLRSSISTMIRSHR